MPESAPARCYCFGIFEADTATGELRRNGMRVRLHAQPFQILTLLLARPGEMLTREEICRDLWPQDTFVDFDHGVNSAINRLREALGDRATNPRFIETLARRGYRFIAPVAILNATAPLEAAPPTARTASFLATPEDLPSTSPTTARTLFLLLQLMYLGFYVGALANLSEIDGLLSALPHSALAFTTLAVTATCLIPARIFLICAVLLRAPRFAARFTKLWPLLLVTDLLWSLAPFLLLHHMSAGLALACVTPLVYAPFAQRSLMLMGAANSIGKASSSRA